MEKNQKHKIVLYNPEAVFYDMPLALIALGSCFDKEKYEIVIIDGRLCDGGQTVLENIEGAVCFGVTVLTGKPIQDALKVTRMVKEKCPDIPTIWGGWHTSLFPKQPLEEEPSIDITVQGQGEITFQELVDSFVSKSSLKDVKGICYREEGQIVQNAPRAISNMDELPEADYELIDVEKYFEKKGYRQFDYITSIGCFYRCTFCADPYVFGRKFSAISSERMVQTITKYQNKYGFESINFQDETFFTYRKRVVGMAEGLIDNNISIKWNATMRADQGDRLSEEDFQLLAKSGFARALVGVESGSQEMMDWLKKDIKMEQVTNTAEKCRKAGVAIQFPFIVGFPEESEKAFRNSVNFVIQLNNMSPKFRPVIFYYKPYPGTPITDELVRNGYQMPNSLKEWSQFDYVSNSGPWITEERKQEIERLKFYIRMANSKHTLSLVPKTLANFRMKRSFFKFPIEKTILDLVKPEQQLS
ncbi:B12-binding domain-containing radical SAM protein [bacterium SCSIO 12741]|nr:B12-binding domain-containing radical SAM protein [bacterium SCSIO 12741]